MAASLHRRHLLMPAILAVHGLLLALIALNPAASIGERAIAAPITIVDVAPAEDSVPVPEPQPVVPDVVTPKPVVDLELEAPPAAPEPVFDAKAAASAGFGTTCEVAGTLARAFLASEAVRTELGRIGPEARSVANAVMFWDGKWVEIEGRAPPEAVDTLRRAIIEGVKAAPPECLTQDVEGPRFIAVDEGTRTLMLVLGSGKWRWGQILEQHEQGLADAQ